MTAAKLDIQHLEKVAEEDSGFIPGPSSSPVLAPKSAIGEADVSGADLLNEFQRVIAERDDFARTAYLASVKIGNLEEKIDRITKQRDEWKARWNHHKLKAEAAKKARNKAVDGMAHFKARLLDLESAQRKMAEDWP